MYSEFAYSQVMRLLLMVFAFSYNFALFFCISNVLLKAHNQKASFRQKALFAFLNGSVMYTGFSYFVYFIGGMVSFSPQVYLIVVTPNPFMALIYCFLGIKILGLSSIRSIQLMGDIFLYNAIINSFARLNSAIFFVQDSYRYNYLMDFMHLAVNLVIFIFIYYGTCAIIKKWPNLFATKTHMLVKPHKDLALLALKSSLIYIIAVCFPLNIPNLVFAHFTGMMILSMLLICSLLASNYQQVNAKVRNNELHINSLLKASDEFRAIKHDFYNILQTYNGYFEIRDYEACKRYHDSLLKITLHAGEAVELNHRMPEHPTLVSLLMQKQETAAQLSITMDVFLRCALFDLPLNEIELCRVVSCLLDNAIEAANESEQRHLSFVMEQEALKTRLIIITNSTKELVPTSAMFISGFTTKPGHQGIGLHTVRNIINKHSNCSFQMNYLNHEMVTYLALTQE